MPVPAYDLLVLCFALEPRRGAQTQREVDIRFFCEYTEAYINSHMTFWNLTMATKAKKRVLVALPEQTVLSADSVWRKANYPSRNAFIDQATRWFIQELSKKKLRDALVHSYQTHAEEDAQIAADWDATLTDGLESA